jgi:hypothetical protein
MLLDPGGPGIASRIAFALAGTTQLVEYRLGTHALFIRDDARSLHLRYGLHALCLRFTLVVTFQLARLDTGPVLPATPAGLPCVSRRKAGQPVKSHLSARTNSECNQIVLNFQRTCLMLREKIRTSAKSSLCAFARPCRTSDSGARKSPCGRFPGLPPEDQSPECRAWVGGYAPFS